MASETKQDAFLRRLAELVEDGRCAGQADIAALQQSFGPLQTFNTWLGNSGKSRLAAAMVTPKVPVALR